MVPPVDYEKQEEHVKAQQAKTIPVVVALSGGTTPKALKLMRDKSPLVQCITNFVSMDIMANSVLAAGASPAMAHSLEEVEDFIGIADCLLVNMGTLDPSWLSSMKLCAKRCVELGKPWVLDPVGAGSTPYRTKAVLELLRCKPTVIRGNAGEIMALAGSAGNMKGVDSTAEVKDAHSAAIQLAKEHFCVVAVSGEVDFVTDGQRKINISNGSPMLTKITAAGCSLTAIIAAFCASMPRQYLAAAAHALAYFGVAGELAAEPQEGTTVPPGPGTARVKLIDALYSIGDTELERVKMKTELVDWD